MKRIILRNVQDNLGTRYLDATFAPNGDLVIEGQDLGDGVEAAFGAGMREYEWSYTIAHADLAALSHALQTKTDLLTVLGQRFSNEQASELQPFLDTQNIPYRFWSRIGD